MHGHRNLNHVARLDYGSPITRHKITQAEQIKGDQMGKVCSTHGRRAYEVLWMEDLKKSPPGRFKGG